MISSDGITLLKDKESIIEQWREHFSNLLNRPSTVKATAMDWIPEKVIMDDLDLPLILDKVKKAIKHTSISKASGIHGLAAEIFRAAAPDTLNIFHNI